jgi:hypothetical protein
MDLSNRRLLIQKRGIHFHGLRHETVSPRGVYTYVRINFVLIWQDHGVPRYLSKH